MVLAAADMLQLLPNFTDSCHHFHDQLVEFVAIPLTVIGFGVCIFMAWNAHNFGLVAHKLVRVMIVAIMCGSLGAWGDQLNDMVIALVSSSGFNASGANPGNLFEAYRAAIARKWGTDSVAEGNKQLYNSVKGKQPIQSLGSTTTHLTHYGYEKPGEKGYDTKSAAGIGNHDNRLTDGQSVALSKDVADQYGIKVGDSMTLTLANGDSITRVYDDTVGDDPDTGKPLTGIVDLYDPQNQYASLSGTGVSGINGLGIQSLSNSPAWYDVGGWVSRVAEGGWYALWAGAVYLISLAACVILWISSFFQQVLYLIEVAISPVFIAMLMIPQLSGIATAFLLSFAGICCLPLAWAITDLLCKVLIDLAVNPTNNLGLAVANSLGVFGMWIGIATLIFFSAIFMPFKIMHMFMGGRGAVGAILGGATSAPSRAAAVATSNYRAAVLGATALRAGAGAIGAAAGNGASKGLPSPSVATGARPNFAVRPHMLPDP